VLYEVAAEVVAFANPKFEAGGFLIVRLDRASANVVMLSKTIATAMALGMILMTENMVCDVLVVNSDAIVGFDWEFCRKFSRDGIVWLRKFEDEDQRNRPEFSGPKVFAEGHVSSFVDVE
jgi:hypothetical protein